VRPERPLDPPRRGPHADPLPLRGGLSSQVGGAIAGAQILPVSEGGAAAHNCQVDVLAIAEHLGHGADVLSLGHPLACRIHCRPVPACFWIRPACRGLCWRKLTCRQLGSFARAQKPLTQGHGYLDKNGDGVTCESLRWASCSGSPGLGPTWW